MGTGLIITLHPTMQLQEKPTFDHKDRGEIYEFVERHGSSDPETVRRALGMGERAFGHHLATLKRNGVIKECGKTIRLAFDAGETETIETEAGSLTIRQASQEDLEGLVDAITEIVESGDYVRAESVADILDNEGVVLRQNDIESRIFFVAALEDAVVGWVHLDHRELEKLNHTAELTLGVRADYQGQGIGSHLLDRGLEWAAAQGVERVYNSVPATNKGAIAFLEEREFETEAVRPDHYKLGGEYIDEVMMDKEL